MKLVHLSDLHVSTRDDAEYRNLRLIVAHIIEHHADAVVAITGDFVNDGTRDEFDVVCGLLQPLVNHCRLVLLTPGNHDVRHWGTVGDVDHRPFEEFRSGLTRVSYGYPYCMEIDGVQLIALDSTAEATGMADLARGELGYLQRLELSKYLEIGEPHTRVVMCHHHPFDRGVGLELEDSEQLLATLSSRCDLLLFGHRHTWDAWSDAYGIGKIFAADKSTQPHDGALRFRVFEITPDGITHTTEKVQL